MEFSLDSYILSFLEDVFEDYSGIYVNCYPSFMGNFCFSSGCFLELCFCCLPGSVWSPGFRFLFIYHAWHLFGWVLYCSHSTIPSLLCLHTFLFLFCIFLLLVFCRSMALPPAWSLSIAHHSFSCISCCIELLVFNV